MVQDDKPWSSYEINLYMRLFSNDVFLASRLASCLPVIRHDLAGTEELVKFENWLISLGVSVPDSVFQCSEDNTWSEIFSLLSLIFKHSFRNPKDSFRRSVWFILGFS